MVADRTGIKWSREETILAFDLYCRTPFGKISQGNPEIIKLAHLLGRTPGSVGLKMHNLAHYDPELQKSITGEYVKEFEDGEPIYFEGSDAKPKPKLTYTLQDPSFDKVFVKVKSWLINLLSGVTEIEIYKVSDVTNRQLRFNRMREYLIDHIGEYVFSRANVSEIIFIQIVELVGRTNKQLFLKNSLKINRMLYYMKIKTKSSRYKMWQQKEYYQLY